MDEQAARSVALVRAVESTDQERQILSDDDRRLATRFALELAQRDAVGGLTPARARELLLTRRARQLLDKVAEHAPEFSALVQTRDWLGPLGAALPIVALLAGVLIDRITDPHRVDLLSAPLLLIIFWNLAMVAASLLWLALPARVLPRLDLRIWRQLAHRKAGTPRGMQGVLVAAADRFGAEWQALSAPLITVRLQRILHASAACFAAGAVVSLYWRGVLSLYRAGWESTFLDADQVHTILAIVFLPAIKVFGLPGFTVADVQALQYAQPASAAGAALWVHLYAGSIMLLVVLPRLALLLVASWQAGRLSRRFPLDLDTPYFRKLTGELEPSMPAVLRVFPYSFTLDPPRQRALDTVARMLLGERAQVSLCHATSYGDELQPAPRDATAGSATSTQTVALFNLSATPEKENHGAFLDRLQRVEGAGLAALIDESGYLERVAVPPSGRGRVDERIVLWRGFCEQHGLRACIVNLLEPHARQNEIDRTLAAAATAR